MGVIKPIFNSEEKGAIDRHNMDAQYLTMLKVFLSSSLPLKNHVDA